MLTIFIEKVVNRLSCYLFLMIFTLLGWFMFCDLYGFIINGLLLNYMIDLFSLDAGRLPGSFGNFQTPFNATNPRASGMNLGPTGPPPGGSGQGHTFTGLEAHASSNDNPSNDQFDNNTVNQETTYPNNSNTVQPQVTGVLATDVSTLSNLMRSLAYDKENIRGCTTRYGSSIFSPQALYDMVVAYHRLTSSKVTLLDFFRDAQHAYHEVPGSRSVAGHLASADKLLSKTADILANNNRTV